MTVSHFASHEAALAAQNQVETWWPRTETQSVSFPVNHIYLLQLHGDSGQFLRVADIALGGSSCKGSGTETRVALHHQPIPFRQMPTREQDWVFEERLQLKQRRNGHHGKNKRRNGRNDPSRVPDSPDVIATKRAARQVKREQHNRVNLNDDSAA
jgi:hypothetical protein